MFRSLAFVLLLGCASGSAPVPADAGQEAQADVQAADLRVERGRPSDPACWLVQVCGVMTNNVVYAAYNCVTPEGVHKINWCGYTCVWCNQVDSCLPSDMDREDQMCVRDCAVCKTEDEWLAQEAAQ